MINLNVSCLLHLVQLITFLLTWFWKTFHFLELYLIALYIQPKIRTLSSVLWITMVTHVWKDCHQIPYHDLDMYNKTALVFWHIGMTIYKATKANTELGIALDREKCREKPWPGSWLSEQESVYGNFLFYRGLLPYNSTNSTSGFWPYCMSLYHTETS